MVDYRIRLSDEDTRPDALWAQIPDDHAVRVGRFMAAMSLVEFKLEMIIWHLIGANTHDLRVLTARLDASRKRDAIDELLKLRVLTADQQNAWDAAKPLLGRLSEARSRIAHGLWLPIRFGEIGALSTRRGKAPGSIARIRPIDVEKNLDQWIAKAGQAVSLLNKFLPCEPTPPPRRP
jgi:hypothetical protein